MIVLTSNGLSSPGILEAVQQRITGKRAALVVTASLELIGRYTPERNSQGIADLSGLNLTDV